MTSKKNGCLDLIVSQKVYKTGDILVGMIRCKNTNNTVDSYLSQRLLLYVAGRCRINERWHHHSFGEQEEEHPCHSSLPKLSNGKTIEKSILTTKSNQHATNKVSGCCIWSTNVLHLQDETPTRIIKKETCSSQKCKMTTDWYTYYNHQNDLEYSQEEEEEEGKQVQSEEEDDIVFIFHVKIPCDLPPSITTIATKYSYSVVLVIQDDDDDINPEIRQVPFHVVQSDHNHNNIHNSTNVGGGRIKVGTCHVLPSLHCRHYVSPTKQYLLPFETNNNPPPLSSSFVSHIPIKNAQGHMCGSLILLSNPKTLLPGGIFTLQLDFTSTNIPSHKVNICLEQMEYISILSSQEEEQQNRRLVRRNILDSQDYFITPSSVLTIQMRLPLETLPTFQTDIVQMIVTCKLDFTISSTNYTETNNKNNKYQVLSLEIPCQVIPPQSPQLILTEEDNDTDIFDWKTFHQSDRATNGHDDYDDTISLNDIENDLTQFSLYLLNK